MKHSILIFFSVLMLLSSCTSDALLPERNGAFESFCEIMNTGEFDSLSNETITEVLYFDSLERKLTVSIDDRRRVTTIAMLKSFKQLWQLQDCGRMTFTRGDHTRDENLKNMPEDIKRNSYVVNSRNGFTFYLFFKQNKIASFTIVNFGGQRNFFGFG